MCGMRIDELKEVTDARVTASGGDWIHYDDDLSNNDDLFMAECWKRTKEHDSAKCDACHLRFKCYTSRDPESKIFGEGNSVKYVLPQ